MAKFTAIVDAESGEIIGGAHGHVGQAPGTEGVPGGLIAGPNQKIEHIEISDHLVELNDPAEFYAQLRAHLRK